MAKQGYPGSLNCWLRDYPRYIKVTFGSEMGNLDGPWGNGSVLLLERIGFDAPDTDPVVDEVPPDIKVTYSNNGTDVDWVFKIGMYAWGTFFATTEGSNYYVDLEKWLEFESTYFDKKKFRHRSVEETQIAKTESIPNVTVPEEIIYDPIGDIPPPNPIEPPATTNYWEYLAKQFIEYYWDFLNLDSINSISVSSTQTSNLDIVGKQVGPVSACGGNATVEWWSFGGKLKIILYQITYECEEWIIGEPVDCTYSRYVSEAYYWNSIIVNGQDQLPRLFRRIL